MRKPVVANNVIKVSEVSTVSAAFITLGPELSLWSDPSEYSYHWLEGNFVKAQPPQGIESSQLAMIEKKLREVAKHVLMLPVQQSSVVAINTKVEIERLRPRAVVQRLVEDSNSTDKQLLGTLCDSLMAKVKL